MNTRLIRTAALVIAAVVGVATAAETNQSGAAGIPLPEHPRPDFERADWLNLNGEWDFRFDGEKDYSRKILVPFGWGAPLSGVNDDGDTGWYRRSVTVPAAWKGKRVFVVIGAADHDTTCFFAGENLGLHVGGYTPFEYELTELVKWGEGQELSFRIWDPPGKLARNGHYLYGKQGYGNARGIWQTVYLEARDDVYVDRVEFLPNLGKSEVTVRAFLSDPAKAPTALRVAVDGKTHEFPVAAGEALVARSFRLERPRLWSLEDPQLYDVTLTLGADVVRTYFGFREIGVGKTPNGDSCVTLNGKPVYLQLCLDQSYHPEGWYTFPSDEFMKNEILLSKKLALSGNRVHIKVEVPRKLYWADRLGVLIQADVPCAWGDVSEAMFEEHWKCFEGMLKRDFNHPSVYQWTLFNETWGLYSNRSLKMGLASGAGGAKRAYRAWAQRKVAEAYGKAKLADPTRLVEDNSAVKLDHVITDVNSWHAYRPGYKWEEMVRDWCDKTFVGSAANYIGGRVQRDEPMMNSECGNVWGYEGSTGDCDFTWDYHLMMNAFRRHLKCTGWLYTEHHDVCNEWNGYVRFDRSPKYDGLDELAGMTIADFHRDAAIFFAGRSGRETGELCARGQAVKIPVGVSLITDRYVGKRLSLAARTWYWNGVGERVEGPVAKVGGDFVAKSWQCETLWNHEFVAPAEAAAGAVVMTLAADGVEIARNFWSFGVPPDGPEKLAAAKAEWSNGSAAVLDGLKLNGFGKGFFEFVLAAPATGGVFRAELGAKRWNGKDRRNGDMSGGVDYMLGGGFNDRSRNPNSYPQTSEERHASHLKVYVGGKLVRELVLADDPADHRGLLSWLSQPHDFRLREAGSYGYLVSAPVPAEAVKDGKVTVRLEADDGLAVYGGRFGRYPFGPHVAPLGGPLAAREVVTTPQAPVLVERRGDVTFVDFGKDAFGWLELDVPPGATGAFEVRLGEKLAADGTIDRKPGGTVRFASVPCRAETAGRYRVPLVADVRNTRGANAETASQLVPIPEKFGVIMPFRYVEVCGAPFAVAAEGIRRTMLHWPIDMSASSFRSSSPQLNRVYEMCKYSILATSFAGVYVDGDRERIPYEADAYLNALGHYAIDADFELARRTFRHLVAHPTWPTEWKQHLIFLAWADWMYSGSPELAREFWEVLRNDKLMLGLAREDGLLVTSGERRRGKGSDIVDWPPGERDGFVFTPVNAVINAFHVRNLVQLSELAAALGKADDAAFLAARAERAKASFGRVFLDAGRGVYVDGEGTSHASLHANAAALAMGLVPAELKAKVADFLVRKGMSCSVYFAQYLLEALFEGGRGDAAIRLMLAKGERSWVGMLEQGSTIAMEAWSLKAKPNQDWNHAWGTAALNVLTRYVLGVRPTRPGFAAGERTPFLGPLQFVEGTVPTVRGPVSVRAERPVEGVPELLVTQAGEKVTDAKGWERVRRPEILDFFARDVYGRRPVGRPPHLVFTALEPDRTMMDGAAVRKRVRVEYGGPFGTNSFDFTAFVPTAAKKPVPAFLLICNRGYENIDPERRTKSGFWPAEEIVRRGFAALAFQNGELSPDCEHGKTQGVYPCFEADVFAKYRSYSQWGVLSAWAWGASRVMDWIETEPSIDARHVAVVGHSRGGKTALVAGAWDTRFALVCSNDSGCNGAKLNRASLPDSEHFRDMARSRGFWLCNRWAEWVNLDAEMPFDQHEFLALIAPRLLCVGSASEDAWAGPYGEYQAARFASPAWELYGRQGLVSSEWPRPGEPQLAGSVGYHLRAGPHDLTPADWKVYMDFAERHGFLEASR